MTKASSPPSLASVVQAELRKFPGLDPRAVLAIAAHEGLGGGIGDNGTSFGPFQLHYGGAYPSSAPRGAAASQAWATSPAGIDYALERINSVAGGLHGLPAIQAISSRFERPANVAGEVADAASHYGAHLPAASGFMGSAPRPSGPSPAAGSSGAAPPQQNGLAQMLAAAIGNANQTVGLPNPAGLGSLLAKAAAGKTMGPGR